MHHGLHLAAPDLLGAAALGECRDGANGLRVRLLFQDRLEVAVQAAELGGERLLRRRAPRGHSLRRLFLEMNQEEPQQVSGLPGWDARGLTCFRRVRGLRPPRLEVPECGRDIVTYLGAGRKVVDVAFDHGFLDSRSSPQHHARDQSPHRMQGHPRRAHFACSVPHGNRQADFATVLPLVSGGGDRGRRRRDQTERQARRARPNRLDQLRHERTAEHGNLGVRGSLERGERERHAQALVIPEKRPLALGQAQPGVIGAECGLFHAGEHAVALQQRPDTRIGERIGLGDLGTPVYGQTPSRGFTRALRALLALGLALRLARRAAFHAASAWMSMSTMGRRSTCATSVMTRPALVMPLSRTGAPGSGCWPSTPIGSIDSSASSTSFRCKPSRRRFVSHPGALTTWLVPSPSRSRPGTDSVSNRRSSRMALSSGAMRELSCSCSLAIAPLVSMSTPRTSTRRAKSCSLLAASHSSASRPSNLWAPPNSPRIRSNSPTTISNSLIFWSSSWRMYDSIVPAAARLTMWTSRFWPMRCSRPMRCSTTMGFHGRS